ncbi:glycosyltransferase [Terrabacter sp. BE26]|uniref:glycosyltransferase n=1 Tax=Terrabacter sp. BE26 TaxID=2898152 RepID=UPI0035BE998F
MEEHALVADGSGFIVVAVHRPHAHLLRRQLQSIRAQTLADWTCLVGVDGEDAGAAALARAAVGNDPRFNVVEFPDNAGVYRHFERLLTFMPAGAGWVALSDQDDYWYPHKLEVLASALAAPNVAAVASRARVVTIDGVCEGLTRRRAGGVLDMLLMNQVTGSHAAFSAGAVRGALPFPDGGPGAIHDHWLAVCAAGVGCVAQINSVLQDYVQHGANVIGESRPPNPAKVVSLVSDGRFDIHLFVDRPWQWRSAMAQALMGRAHGLPHEADLRSVATGRWNAELGRLLLIQALRRRTPFLICLALAWGAIRHITDANPP